MSDRPRTDALFDRCKNKSNIECMAELEELCRTIEGELSEVTKQRDALAEAIRSFTTDFESIKWGYDGDCGSQRLVDHLFESLAAVKGGSYE